MSRASGSGTNSFNGLNTYTGGTTVTQGTLGITTLADSGAASSLGTSGAVTLQGGTLRYTGTGHSTNRLFTLGGITNTTSKVDASGSGAMVFAGPGNIGYTVAGRNFTLKLGGTSTGGNMLAGVIANNGAGIVSVTKEDAGRWVVSGANTYTGATTVTGGTLGLQGFSSSAASLDFAAGTTLKFDLGTPGNFTALLALTGNLVKNGSGIYTLDFSGTGQAGIYNLISCTGTTFTSETDFTITNPGADLEALLSLDSGVLSLILTATTVLEPSTYATVAGVLALAAVTGRSRRRN